MRTIVELPPLEVVRPPLEAVLPPRVMPGEVAAAA
jgi:hypothetical protein